MRLPPRRPSDHPGIQSFRHYERMLGRYECTAPFAATPVSLHAEQAVTAVCAGRDVLRQVAAAQTMNECWAWVEAVEATGRTHMLAESRCYRRENVALLPMAKEGVFGDVCCAEGAYVHQVPDPFLAEQGNLTWRGQLALRTRGNRYPTHSLGPVAQWRGRLHVRPPRRRARAALDRGPVPRHPDRCCRAVGGPRYTSI